MQKEIYEMMGWVGWFRSGGVSTVTTKLMSHLTLEKCWWSSPWWWRNIQQRKHAVTVSPPQWSNLSGVIYLLWYRFECQQLTSTTPKWHVTRIILVPNEVCNNQLRFDAWKLLFFLHWWWWWKGPKCTWWLSYATISEDGDEGDICVLYTRWSLVTKEYHCFGRWWQ